MSYKSAGERDLSAVDTAGTLAGRDQIKSNPSVFSLISYSYCYLGTKIMIKN